MLVEVQRHSLKEDGRFLSMLCSHLASAAHNWPQFSHHSSVQQSPAYPSFIMTAFLKFHAKQKRSLLLNGPKMLPALTQSL